MTACVILHFIDSFIYIFSDKCCFFLILFFFSLFRISYPVTVFTLKWLKHTVFISPRSSLGSCRCCAHLPSLSSPLPPSPFPPLLGCSPAGGPVIPAAPLCRPAGISPASAEQRTQLTGSAVGAGGVLLLEAWLPYFLSISQALLETQNNKDKAICRTGTVLFLRFTFQSQSAKEVSMCVCLGVWLFHS